MHTRQMTRPTLTPVVALLLVVSLLANVALSVVAFDLPSSLSGSDAKPAAVAAPKAYDVDGAGDGLVGPGIPRSATINQAYWQPYLGEGRTNVAALRAAEALPLITYDQPMWQGEGRTNVTTALRRLSQVEAYAVLGQGEGWVRGGLGNEHAIAIDQLLAKASCGQGEGLVQHAIDLENPCR
jgi:hypothetical protein